MTSRHLVDPELLPLLDAWPAVRLADDILEMVRARDLPIADTEGDGVTIERRRVPGPVGAPDISLSIYRPKEAGSDGVSANCLYHIHGGGFVTGKVSDFEALHRQLVAALGCTLVAVEYRLAPETPHPGPIEDCYAGLVWVHQNADALGIDANCIGVVGESAGGGLAAGLALLARDRKGPGIAFQCLNYPMLDDRTCSALPPAYVGEFIWPPHNNRFGWRALLGCEPGGPGVSAYAAPSRADDLAGLPPAFVMTGALDLFLEEDIDYSRRLLIAGVPCEFHVYPGAFHGFDLMPGAQVATQAQADRIRFLKRMIAR